MTKRKDIYFLILVACVIVRLLVLPAEAAAVDHEIAGGGGISTSSLQATQGTIIWAWIKELNSFLDLRIEPNVEVLVARSGETIVVGGITPVLRLGTHGKAVNPFLDLGAGVSFSSKKKISDWDLGGYFFFSPTAGAGVKFGRSAKGISLFVRLLHHSNADLFPPNQSLNALYVLLGYRF